MSGFLLASSFLTTVLIPQDEFQPGGEANGRALAFLAHEYLGPIFGTTYDLSTIFILWFAGASAMAGLLNLVPRYLPRYGMAPEWAGAIRPLVVTFTLVAFLDHLDLRRRRRTPRAGPTPPASCVLITSASIAVILSARRRRQTRAMIGFAVVAVVFAYTTVVNIIERPDGVKIAACFIVAIVVISLASRISRSFELRVGTIELDPTAAAFFDGQAGRDVQIIAHDPDAAGEQTLGSGAAPARREPHSRQDTVMFLEVTVTDASDFATDLYVRAVYRNGRRVLELAA